MSSDEFAQRAQALGLWGLLAHRDELDPKSLRGVLRWIQWEEQERARRSQQRRLRSARIGRFKALADFDWSWPKRCDRGALQSLMELAFISEPANVVLLGPNGVGKTMIAHNIAYQAVTAGHSVRFTSAADMLNDLAAQDGASALKRRLKHYASPALLVIDELGYLSYGNRHADLLFEIVNRRYQQRATLVTTNKPFAEWSELFPNAACLVSLIDRLIHKADVFTIEGESYRLKEAKERAARRIKPKEPRL